MKKLIQILNHLLNLPTRVFSKISLFAYINKSDIHNTVAILTGTRVYWSSIKKYTYISDHCWIIKAEIGGFCSIASNVMIGGGKHPIHFVSTSPVFYSKKNILKTCFKEVDFEEYSKTVIGSDVWIGSNAFVKGGITIGNGAVIGAYSVVTKDVEPYSIVAGNPAKLIKKRFDDSTIERLQNIRWWDQSDKELREKARYFEKIDDFLQLQKDD